MEEGLAVEEAFTQGGVGVLELVEGSLDGGEGGIEIADVGLGDGNRVEDSRVVRVGGVGLHLERASEDFGRRDGRPVGGGEAPQDVVPDVGAAGGSVENAEEEWGGLFAVAVAPVEDGEREKVFDGDDGSVWEKSGLVGERKGFFGVASVECGTDGEAERGRTGGGVAREEGKGAFAVADAVFVASPEVFVVCEEEAKGGGGIEVFRHVAEEHVVDGGAGGFAMEEAVGLDEAEGPVIRMLGECRGENGFGCVEIAGSLDRGLGKMSHGDWLDGENGGDMEVEFVGGGPNGEKPMGEGGKGNEEEGKDDGGKKTVCGSSRVFLLRSLGGSFSRAGTREFE